MQPIRMTALARAQFLKIRSRHQPAAGPAHLRAGAVCLSGQPFPQSRARQYLAGCAGMGRPLPCPVLAVSAGRDHLLHRRAGSCRSRDLGALRAPAISLEGDRAVAARAGPKHPGAPCRPRGRHAARPEPVRRSKALSAGTLRILGGLALPNQDDDGCAGHRLDPWQHRSLFLAADEGVLQARRPLPPGRGGPGADAGVAGPLPKRTERRERKRRRRMAGGQSLAEQGRHAG